MNRQTVESLRRRAISHSLFSPDTLRNAIARLSFVQADPIRAPARAQDLILRQRVENYKAGDLERDYPNLEIEEDFLYAYGFMTGKTRQLLHPRTAIELSEFERRILDTIEKSGETHPKHLKSYFGDERVVNAWGGFSKATTGALERLHRYGFLRVARRTGGIRVYEISPTAAVEVLSLYERVKKIICIAAAIFAPVTEKSLREALTPLRRWWLPVPVNIQNIIDELLKSGELEKQTIDGIGYLSPSGTLNRDDVPRTVRILAPFDPLVWDRRRFEHFWGWAYRFEAYTPAPKRLRGYYAMPLLWDDKIIGWVNAQVRDGTLDVETGFVGEKPDEPDFYHELEREIEKLKIFLKLEKK